MGITKIEATDIQGGGDVNEQQTVTLDNATGGTFRLAFEGDMTAPLAYNATAAQVDAALEAMSSVDNVSVTGSSGGPWTITFGGTQSGENVARLDGDISAATAGTLERTISYAYDAQWPTHVGLRSRQQLCDHLRPSGPRDAGG